MARICKVLVVEDNDDVRSLLGDIIDQQGFRFMLVANGAEARQALDAEPFDIAVIDISLPLPGGDGFAIAEHASERGVGVILTSGNPLHRERLEEGRHAFLLKPFRMHDLIALIEVVLNEVDADCAPEPPSQAATGD